VAKVISVTRQSAQPYAEILAEPTANINRANHVLLLWPYHDPKRAKADRDAVKEETPASSSETDEQLEEATDAE
jgi:rod shape-determining protein MreC